MITLKDVSKSYTEGAPALSDINIQIDEGEFVFVVGDSGSGKSTLIKLLLKELEPTSGTIVINDKILSQIPRRQIPRFRRNVGCVFQDFRLLKDRNVYENVAFAQRVISAPNRSIKEKVPKMLSLVGLAAKYKSKPNQLSGGEQQRVAIARALINEPKILLADEPTGNLDSNNAWEIMKLLDEINKRGTTVLVVSHNMEIVEAMKNCKAVAIMDRCESYNGNGGPLGSEITAGLYRTRTYMEAINYTYGLGGRDFTVEDAKDVFAELADVVENGKPVTQYQYIGLRK